jgi:hypothetical protein
VGFTKIALAQRCRHDAWIGEAEVSAKDLNK